MKKCTLILISLLIFEISKGQEKLSTIAAPTSPASYILGTQPSSVLSPKSFQALEAALYSNFLNNEGKTVLPNDFALEFSPYWASDHGLTLDEYLYPKNMLVQFFRNLSLSAASTQNFVFEDKTASNGVAMGARTTFFFGGETDRLQIIKFQDSLKKAEKSLANIVASSIPFLQNPAITDSKTLIDNLLPSIRKNVESVYGKIPEDEFNAFKKGLISDLTSLPPYNSGNYQDDLYNLLEKHLFKIKAVNKGNAIPVFERFKDYIKNRQGFSLDVAYASFLNFPNNKFNYSFAARNAVWLTPAFNFRNGLNFLKVMIVLRKEWLDTDYYAKYFPSSKKYRSNIDYGGALSGEFKKFSVQLEAVGRSKRTEISEGINDSGKKLYSLDTESDFQCVGTFSYRINKQIALSYSLGQGFEPITNPGKTLVSLLSLNLGFGGPTTDNLVVSK